MSDLDARLRAIARESLDHAAADVDVDRDLAAVLGRERPWQPDESSRWPTRIAVAAAVTALVAGAAVLLAMRDREPGADRVSAPATTSTNPPVASADVASLPTALATVTPTVVRPHEHVTVAPAGIVAPRCPGAAAVFLGAAAEPLGWIEAGESMLVPAPLLDRDLDQCDMERSDAPSMVTIPADLAPGEYRVCVDEPPTTAGCGMVTVVAAAADGEPLPTTTLPTPTTVSAALGEDFLITSGFFAREYPNDPPGVTIRQYGPDGTDMGTLTPEEVDQLLRREQVVLPDGTSLRVDPEVYLDPRCTNAPLLVDGPGGQRLADGIGPVRSIAAAQAAGAVVVGRDTCPEGARWGEPGTGFELLAWDANDPDRGPVQLVHLDPDPDLVWFDDGVVVFAGGERIVESVSPDGRYVAVAELYTTEDARYHVMDAVIGDDPIEFGSGCEDPRDIAGPPQFVGDGLVVLARACFPTEDDEMGGLVVETVDLDRRQPIWTVDVDHVRISSYTSTVDSSARLIDGEVWVLVSGSGGVEQPIRSAVVTRDGAVALPFESLIAFTPAELIESWDAAAS